MKRVLASLLALSLFASPVYAIAWNPVATKVLKSLSYLTGPEGSCTAWSIDEKRDYVLTAAHCDQRTASGESSMLVDNLPTKILSEDKKKDLLVLEVKGLDKPALRLAKYNPKIGDEVASYGYGYALERPFFRVTHISDDQLYIPYEGIGGPLILTDNNFIPGQSGGPVFDENGDVVMIVQMGSDTGFGLGVGAETIKNKMGKFFAQEPKP